MNEIPREAAVWSASGQSAPRREFDAAYDVVIVGGGPAGLAGALSLGRARRSVLVVDAGEPRNAPAGHVHNFLGSEGIAPNALLASGRVEVAEYGVGVVAGSVLAAERLEGDQSEAPVAAETVRFRVDLADGRSVRARRLLIATGLVDELPEVPGVAERWGRDVLHCPYCHGWEVRDRAIGVLGTGPLAIHGALLWRQLSADVVLFRHTSPALNEEQGEQLAARGVRLVEGEVAALEIADDVLVGLRLRSGDLVPREVVAIAPRFVARAGVLVGLGLETADLEMGGQVFGSYVPADPTGATSAPGVWAAGNVTDLTAQVITAAAAGLRAGAAINADLVAEDAARAVADIRARNPAARQPHSAEAEADRSGRLLGAGRDGRR